MVAVVPVCCVGGSKYGIFCFIRKFLRILYKIKNNYRRVCPSEARVLRWKRNMPLKRPAAGGESCKAGFFFILWEFLWIFYKAKALRAECALRAKG